MTRHFMIARHPAVITATEIQPHGSQGVVEQVLRFRSLSELIDHFVLLGASAASLEAMRTDFAASGTAALVLSQE
jgi:hypothetical protein